MSTAWPFRRKSPEEKTREEVITLIAMALEATGESMSPAEAVTRAEWYVSQIEANVRHQVSRPGAET